MSNMAMVTIGKAALDAGVNVETIRFYERRGLIDRAPKRGAYRVYSPEQVARIRFIKEAQQIGFSLREIGDLLALRADPAADCSAVKLQAVEKLDEVNRKIGQLRVIGSALETLIAACPGRGALRKCSIMEALTLRSSRAPAAAKRAASTARRRRITEERMKAATIKILGMHCNGCAETVKAVIEREPGVQSALISYDDAQARILYDASATSEDRLISAIQQLGYRARLEPQRTE